MAIALSELTVLREGWLLADLLSGQMAGCCRLVCPASISMASRLQNHSALRSISAAAVGILAGDQRRMCRQSFAQCRLRVPDHDSVLAASAAAACNCRGYRSYGLAVVTNCHARCPASAVRTTANIQNMTFFAAGAIASRAPANPPKMLPMARMRPTFQLITDS